MPEPAMRAATWMRVALGDVVRQVKDRVNPEKSGLERYVAGEHLDTDDLRIRRWGEIGDGYLGPAFHMRFKPGHVLYGSRRTYLRKVAVADFEGITANTTYVLESKDPNLLLPALLPFVMQTEAFNRHSVRESKGSVNPYVNFSDLAWYEFALPPIEEQHKVLRMLGAAQQLREKYDIASVATTRLLESQFAEVIGGSNRPLPPRLRSLIDVSEWSERSVGELCRLGGGHGFRPSEWSDTGMPIIRIQNVRGSREFNYFNGIPDPSWIVEPGELLFAWAGVPGVSFGPGIWPGPRAVLNQHIYRVTPHEWVQRDWLYEVLLFLTPRIERRAHGFKASLLHIRKEEFTSQRVLVPPAEQQAILSTWMTEQRRIQDALSSKSSATNLLYHSILNGVWEAA